VKSSDCKLYYIIALDNKFTASLNERSHSLSVRYSWMFNSSTSRSALKMEERTSGCPRWSAASHIKHYYVNNGGLLSCLGSLWRCLQPLSTCCG